METHAALLQAAFSAVTATVWIVYLHGFLTSMGRHRRSEILVTSGAGRDLAARCFVANLGLEPIYVLDIQIELSQGARRWTMEVTDGEVGEGTGEGLATAQGPLASGAHRDIGSFGTLIRRALSGAQAPPGEPMHVSILVIAATPGRAVMAAARRDYEMSDPSDPEARITARATGAHQIRGWRHQQGLRRRLEASLVRSHRAEAAPASVPAI
ncbi:hypothetical protein [Frigidibacter sp. MR17.24]|uniref:hypothetical protein n=1 Tax=Frigidibacter sp. MR17.24 TaxID=3127345 RepID=UPI003012E7BB